MRPVLAVTVILLAGSAAAATLPAASAQLSRSSNTLWADVDTSQAGTAFGYKAWLDPGEQGSPSQSEAIYRCRDPTGSQPSQCDPGVSIPPVFTLPVQPPLAQPVYLDGNGSVEMDAFLAAYTCAPDNPAAGCFPIGAGSFSVAAQLLQGSTVVADGAAQMVAVAPSANAPTGAVAEAKWSVPPSRTSILPADGELAWQVTVTPTQGAGNAIALVLSGNTWSHVTLPIGRNPAAAGARLVAQQVAAPAFDLSHRYTAPTYDSYNYTWTAGPAVADLAYAANVTAGSVTFEVRDGKGSLVESGTLARPGASGHRTAGQLAAGAWRIAIEYDGFVGSFRLDLAPHQAGTSSASHQTVSVVNGQTGKASPALETFTLLALAAATVAARRRAPNP